MKNDNNTMVTETDTQLLKQGINSATIRAHVAAERSWVMINTLENKAKFFAQYWGQEVVTLDGINEIPVYKMFNPIRTEETQRRSYLELTPLSQISDEDAIEVSKYIGQDRGAGFEEIVKRNVFGYIYGRLMPSIEIHKSILVIDYLRSRGYALPWMGISVETLVEWGWVKLRGGENG